MLDKTTYTGNKVDKPDFLKVLLTLKENIMKETNVAEVCKVIDIKDDIYIVSPLSNSELSIQCHKIKSLEVGRNDIVLVTFTNTDYKLNLAKINKSKPTYNISEITHAITNGIITGSLSRETTDPEEYTNLLPVKEYVVEEHSGLKFTFAANGRISIKGTSTAVMTVDLLSYLPTYYDSDNYTLCIQNENFKVNPDSGWQISLKYKNDVQLVVNSDVKSSTRHFTAINEIVDCDIFIDNNVTLDIDFYLALYKGNVVPNSISLFTRGYISRSNDNPVRFAEEEYLKSRNLFHFNDSATKSRVGVNFSWDSYTQTMTFAGTPTQTYISQLMTNIDPLTLKAGTTYSMILTGKYANEHKLTLALLSEDETKRYEISTTTAFKRLQGQTEDVVLTKAYVTFLSGATYSFSLKLSVIEGGEGNRYTEYEGPIIHKNNPTITFAESERQKTKNLCYLNSFAISNQGVTATFSSQTQTITFNGTASNNIDLAPYVKSILPTITNMSNKAISISMINTSGSITAGGLLAFLSSLDNNSPYDDRFDIGQFNVGTKSTSRLVMLSNNLTYDGLFFYCGAGTAFDNFTIKIQIEEGIETTSYQYPEGPILHEYSAPGMQCREDYLDNKNLFTLYQSPAVFPLSTGGCTIDVNDYGIISVNGTPNSSGSGWIFGDSLVRITLYANVTYTFSVQKLNGNAGGSSISFVFRSLNSDEDRGSLALLIQNNESQTFTPQEDLKVYYVKLWYAGNPIDCSFGVQIERNDHMTTWMPNNNTVKLPMLKNIVREILNISEFKFTTNTINITYTSFNNVTDIYWYIVNRPYNTFFAEVGNLQSSSVKNILGNPSGFVNYTSVYFRNIGGEDDNNSRRIIEIFAEGLWIGKLARGYIFSESSGNAYFSGWDILR